MKVCKNENAIHHDRPEGIKAMCHLFKSIILYMLGNLRKQHNLGITIKSFTKHYLSLMENCCSSGKKTVN
jgi:hypothetical protein